MIICLKNAYIHLLDYILMDAILLKPWEEYVGKLVKVEKENGRGYLHFSNGGVVVVPNELAVKLGGKVGRRIAVLRTDLPDKQYLWREDNVDTE